MISGSAANSSSERGVCALGSHHTGAGLTTSGSDAVHEESGDASRYTAASGSVFLLLRLQEPCIEVNVWMKEPVIVLWLWSDSCWPRSLRAMGPGVVWLGVWA